MLCVGPTQQFSGDCSLAKYAMLYFFNYMLMQICETNLV
jgi:hypothetical protein